MTKQLFQEFTTTTFEDWKKVVEKELKGKSYDSLLFNVEDDIVLEPYYVHSETKWTLPEANTQEVLNVCRLKINQPKATNQQALNALNSGINALCFSGAVNSYNDFCVLLNGISIQHIQLQFVNTQTRELLNYLKTYCEEFKIDTHQLDLVVDANPLKKVSEEGVFHQSLEADKNEFIAGAKFMYETFSNGRVAIIDASLFHDAGANYTQQIAYACALAIDLIDDLTEAGCSAEQAIKQLQFNFGAGTHLLLEIAKLRAFRFVFKALLNAYGQENLPSPRMQVVTSQLLSANTDSYSNLLRNTISCFAAFCGSANAIEVLAHDESYTVESNSKTQRIARNIFLVLQEEAHLNKVHDPSNGSYYIDQLTHKFYQKAIERLKAIEQEKGYTELLMRGVLQSEIENEFAKLVQQFETGAMHLVGVNKFLNEKEDVSELIQHTLTDTTPVQPILRKRLAAYSKLNTTNHEA